MTTSRRTRTRLTAVEKQATHKFEDGKTSPFDWREHWVGMPAFVQKDTSDSRLRCYADKVWIRTGEPLNPRYPVYIISKGRWSTLHTARALSRMGVPFRIVVEPKELSRYRAAFCDEGIIGKILVAPENFSERGQGSIPVRNFVWQHALDSGAKRHWLMDDNIPAFFRLNRNLGVPVGTGTIFRAVEDFVDRYQNVAFAGLQNSQFCKAKNKQPAVILNTRVYSCTLIKNDLDLRLHGYVGENHEGKKVHVPACTDARWRGRYNEDTDIMLRALKKGYCTMLFVAFHADKEPTMKTRGGNTDELYAGDPKSKSGGRYKMAASLVEQHPDVARIDWRFNRWQHVADYRKAAELGRCVLKQREDLPTYPLIDEYNLVLAKTASFNRREFASVLRCKV